LAVALGAAVGAAAVVAADVGVELLEADAPPQPTAVVARTIAAAGPPRIR
jgi:hypothetical protein